MYKLYWASGSAAFAPQAVLEEGGLDYETVAVDIRKGENLAPDYLAVNPAGYVPALETPEGLVLWEAAATALYLADHHGLDELVPPADAPARGLMYRSLFYLTNTVQDGYKRFYYPERYSTDAADAPRIKEQAVTSLIERWKLVDDHLAANGPFHLGETYGIADLYMTMLVTWFDTRDDLMARYPAIADCYAACAERPAIWRTLHAHGEA